MLTSVLHYPVQGPDLLSSTYSIRGPALLNWRKLRYLMDGGYHSIGLDWIGFRRLYADALCRSVQFLMVVLRVEADELRKK